MKLLEAVISSYSPKRKWFLTPQIIDSIHGRRHIARCLIYASILAERLKITPEETKELLIAISLHDTQRLDDKGDQNHGLRASEWFKSNIKKLTNTWKDLPSLDTQKISYVIKWHDSDNNSVTQNILFKNTLYLIKLSDALDRYRLPKTKWWINTDYLSINPLPSEMKLAHELVIESEKEYLLNQDSVKSIKIALKNHVE